MADQGATAQEASLTEMIHGKNEVIPGLILFGKGGSLLGPHCQVAMRHTIVDCHSTERAQTLEASDAGKPRCGSTVSETLTKKLSLVQVSLYEMETVPLPASENWTMPLSMFSE